MAAAIIFEGKIIEYFPAVADSKLFCLPLDRFTATGIYYQPMAWRELLNCGGSECSHVLTFLQTTSAGLSCLFIYFAFFTHLHELDAWAAR
jgi:hypothetical protein